MPSETKPKPTLADMIHKNVVEKNAMQGPGKGPLKGLQAAKPKPKQVFPKKSVKELTSDVDRIMSGYEDTTGIPPKK